MRNLKLRGEARLGSSMDADGRKRGRKSWQFTAPRRETCHFPVRDPWMKEKGSERYHTGEKRDLFLVFAKKKGTMGSHGYIPVYIFKGGDPAASALRR